LVQTKGKAASAGRQKLHIGIVQARFNEGITNALARPAWPNCRRWACSRRAHHHVLVPGALEVPVALQAMAESDEYDALIALGCIIRGETYHFELVANESGAGVTRMALDYQLPIANAIITTENLEQAIAPDRQGPRRRPRGRGDGQPAGRTVMSDATPCAPFCIPRCTPTQARRARPARRAQGGLQVQPQPRARVRAAGAVPAPGGRQRSHGHRPLHARSGRLSQGRRGALRRLLHGCIEHGADLDALITPLLDRKMAEISPIEHGTMWIGVYEFQHCLDVPWRVVLNECIELAKEFGGTDGHKYVMPCSTAWRPAQRPGRRQGLRAPEVDAAEPPRAGTLAGATPAQRGQDPSP
jgi:6,7-dimethyl-8-ribityllumazine synthase